MDIMWDREKMIGALPCEEGSCTVGVGKECLAHLQQIAGLIVTVGVCAVLQSTGHRGISCEDLYGNHGSQLCCQQRI